MNRYETTFTLTVSTRAESEEAAQNNFTRAQIQLLEWKGMKWVEPPNAPKHPGVEITYLEPSDLIDWMEEAR